MIPKSTRFSQRYSAALGRHLKPAATGGLRPALLLGRHFLNLGLGTLDLAKIHAQALAGLRAPGGLFHRRAGEFFDAANVPLEATRRAARLAGVNLDRLQKLLLQRNRELAAANLHLDRAVQRRKVLAAGFAAGGRLHNQCLAESLQLQRRWRRLARRALAGQERQRARLSHELQDEIVQTLVGINVRLLALKQAALARAKGLKNHIASAQRLVVKSVASVEQYANKLARPPTATSDPLDGGSGQRGRPGIIHET